MNILILGAGQVGRTAADHLSREEANEVTVEVGRTAADHLSREEANEVTVVDVNEEVLRDLQDRLDVRTVAGNAAHPTVLESAGAAEADIIVALTSSDEDVSLGGARALEHRSEEHTSELQSQSNIGCRLLPE